MKRIEAKIIIEDGVITFEGECKDIVYRIYDGRMEQAAEEGRRSVVDNILRNIEKLASK